MAIQRMDNVGVVVDDLAAATAFFTELGMHAEGDAASVAGQWVDRVVGLDDVRVDIRFMSTPDGHGRLELTRFRTPPATGSPAAPNTLGLCRLMFAVDDVDDTVARLRPHGGELVGEVASTGNGYRLCYLRGPGGVVVSLAEQVG